MLKRERENPSGTLRGKTVIKRTNWLQNNVYCKSVMAMKI